MQETTTMACPTTAPAVFTDDGRIHLGPFVDRYLCDADARTKNADLAKLAGAADAASLTAQERATFPRVVIEELPLPAGSFAVHRDAEGTAPHRIAYDPAQTTRAKVEIFINIYIAGSGEYVEYSPEVYRALRGLATYRTADPDPKVIAFWDEVEQQVIASDDPAAAVSRITALITAERAESGR